MTIDDPPKGSALRRTSRQHYIENAAAMILKSSEVNGSQKLARTAGSGTADTVISREESIWQKGVREDVPACAYAINQRET